jgi:hypothetical protein
MFNYTCVSVNSRISVVPEFHYCACVTTCIFEMTPQATECNSQVGDFSGNAWQQAIEALKLINNDEL